MIEAIFYNILNLVGLYGIAFVTLIQKLFGNL